MVPAVIRLTSKQKTLKTSKNIGNAEKNVMTCVGALSILLRSKQSLLLHEKGRKDLVDTEYTSNFGEAGVCFELRF